MIPVAQLAPCLVLVLSRVHTHSVMPSPAWRAASVLLALSDTVKHIYHTNPILPGVTEYFGVMF